MLVSRFDISADSLTLKERRTELIKQNVVERQMQRYKQCMVVYMNITISKQTYTLSVFGVAQFDRSTDLVNARIIIIAFCKFKTNAED